MACYSSCVSLCTYLEPFACTVVEIACDIATSDTATALCAFLALVCDYQGLSNCPADCDCWCYGPCNSSY